MARVNNLSNFLTDVANAIKTKKGSETAIPAANFDTEILTLPSQGTYEQRVLNISANGTQTITPSSGYDAIDELELTVAVPEKQLQSKTYNFTQNTNIQLLPDSGYDGFDTVTLNINVPTIDTSDATATAEDIIQEQTAYVNGEKIEGTLELTNAISIDNSTNTDTSITLMNLGDVPSMIIDADITDFYGLKKAVEDGSSLEIIAPQSQIANVISLTADKIKKGETILEITGTYEGSGGGSGDVKLFKTVADMQADPNPQEGDLAVVYREETQPATESSTFNKCIFPNTVTLDEAFDDSNSGEYNAVDPVSGDFNASCELSSSSFTFNGSGDAIGTINIEYESSDGITYTRTDGGAELQEFGTTIARNAWSDQWVDAIGEFIQLEGDNYFEGLYEATSSGNTITYQLASTQLDATSSYVYGKTFYGQNGIENGALTTNVSNSFADVNAEIVYKIQQQYENMTPRVLTDSDKTIDRNIYFIPTKKSGIPLLDTSNITNAKNLFSRCTLLTTLPGLNVSNATTLESMFEYCSALISIAALDTDSATSTATMFKDCSSLTFVPDFYTSQVTIMSQMFLGCKKLTRIPWFDTSNVKYMYKMFNGCTLLVTIPVLDTSSVIDMGSMFSGCSSLSNAGLINILQMCINATNVTSNKTLKYIGLTSEQATTCGTLYNYQAFLDAGWTTGY